MVYSEITKQEFLWANFEEGCTPWKRESTGLRYTWKAHSPVVDIVNRFHGMTREKAEGVLIARRSLNRPGWLSTIDVTATRMTQPAPTMEDMRFSDRGRLPAVDRSPLSFPSVLLLSSHSFVEKKMAFLHFETVFAIIHPILHDQIFPRWQPLFRERRSLRRNCVDCPPRKETRIRRPSRRIIGHFAAGLNGRG